MSIPKRAPKDFRMESVYGEYPNTRLRFAFTVTTAQEIDAMVEVLLHMRPHVSSHRLAMEGDFGIEVRKPSYSERLAKMWGAFE